MEMKRPYLPPQLNYLHDAYDWQPVTLGMSNTAVYKLTSAADEICFLKVGGAGTRAELQWEAERLAWLNGRLPVPRVLDFVVEDDAAFLLSTAVPGHDFTVFNDKSDAEKETAVRLLAEGLRMFHSLPVANCPLDERLDIKVERARQQMEAGLVDEDNFDAARQGQSSQSLFAELLAARPDEEDLVVAHGDYCLPNVLVKNGKLSGFVDLGLAGVTDRYHDLALVTRSLTHNFGRGWEEKFFASYGIEAPDNAKIEFYRLLDEFA